MWWVIYIGFQNYCMTVNCVQALNSSILLNRLRQNGIRHQYHTRALGKWYIQSMPTSGVLVVICTRTVKFRRIVLYLYCMRIELYWSVEELCPDFFMCFSLHWHYWWSHLAYCEWIITTKLLLLDLVRQVLHWEWFVSLFLLQSKRNWRLMWTVKLQQQALEYRFFVRYEVIHLWFQYYF